MPDNVTVTNTTINGKFHISFKRESTKGIDGFTVEANNDSLQQTQMDAEALYTYARRVTTPESINRVGIDMPKPITVKTTGG
jgi:hypothetical protein